MIPSRAPEQVSTRFNVKDIAAKLPAPLRAEFLKLPPREQQFLLSMNADEAQVYAGLTPAAGEKFVKLPKAERRAEGKLARVARQVERVQPLSLESVRAGAVLCATMAKKPAAPTGSGALLTARVPVVRSRNCGRAPVVLPSKMYLLFSGGVLRP